MDDKKSANEKAAKDHKKPVQNATQSAKVIADLKKTRTGLGKTMQLIKISQEGLQTATKNAGGLTKTAEFRIDALKKHGKGSLAYSSLQSGLQYFMQEDRGYIAYVQLKDNKNSVCVLADPICADADLEEMIDAFLKEKNDPIFLHASHETAKILNARGFCANELGVETIIDIQEFSLSGNKKQGLRQSRNNAKKDGINVIEVRSVDEFLFKAFKKVSDAWMKEKVVSNSDMKFVVRPMVYVDEIDVRRFAAVQNNEIVGFVVYDPMYENGEVVGYIANQLRSAIERNYSLVDAIIIESMEKFKAEGKKYISLGLSPLYKVDDSDEFTHSKLLKAHFQYSYEKANYLYNFKNLARHKNKYRPEIAGTREVKVYCVLKTRFLLTRMHQVYHVLGMSPVRQTFAYFTQRTYDWVKSHFTAKPHPDHAKLESGIAPATEASNSGSEDDKKNLDDNQKNVKVNKTIVDGRKEK